MVKVRKSMIKDIKSVLKDLNQHKYIYVLRISILQFFNDDNWRLWIVPYFKSYLD